MAVVPTTHTFTDGVVTTSEDNAYIRDPIDFLQNKPAARLRQTVAQTLTTGVYAALTFTTEDLDDDPAGTGGHDNVTNPSRYTAQYAGWYQVSGGVYYTANATSFRACRWVVNGSAITGSQSIVQAVTGGAGSSVVARTELIFLNVGDYVELHARQDTGGNLDTNVNGDAMSSMNVEWVRLA